jgi:hypothetical protein
MYLTNLIEAPTKEQLVEEDYATELQLSGLADRGRSGTTGY